MTSKTRSYRPSPALVISCIALFLALTGSALAVGLAKNSVRSAQIVDGGVRTLDLRDNSVIAPKIAPDAVGSEEIAESAVASPEVADQALTASDLGPDSVAASELGAVTVRTNSTKVAKDANGGVSVSCGAGEQVLGGGGQPGHFGTEMTSSRPSGNGWLYQAKNNTGGEDTLTVFALCLAG
jgi:hypothetical protein